jgi:hypothetical protein
MQSVSSLPKCFVLPKAQMSTGLTSSYNQGLNVYAPVFIPRAQFPIITSPLIFPDETSFVVGRVWCIPGNAETFFTMPEEVKSTPIDIPVKGEMWGKVDLSKPLTFGAFPVDPNSNPSISPSLPASFTDNLSSDRDDDEDGHHSTLSIAPVTILPPLGVISIAPSPYPISEIPRRLSNVILVSIGLLLFCKRDDRRDPFEIEHRWNIQNMYSEYPSLAPVYEFSEFSPIYFYCKHHGISLKTYRREREYIYSIDYSNYESINEDARLPRNPEEFIKLALVYYQYATTLLHAIKTTSTPMSYTRDKGACNILFNCSQIMYSLMDHLATEGESVEIRSRNLPLPSLRNFVEIPPSPRWFNDVSNEPLHVRMCRVLLGAYAETLASIYNAVASSSIHLKHLNPNRWDTLHLYLNALNNHQSKFVEARSDV